MPAISVLKQADFFFDLGDAQLRLVAGAVAVFRLRSIA